MLRIGVCAAFSALVLSAAPASAGPSYNWTGLYVGAHGGYNWADIEYPGAAPAPAGPPRPSLESGLVGGQLGYNFQASNIVVGAEVDFSFSGSESTERDGNYLTQSYKIDNLGSIRARLGYALGSFLPFVTAGWAWGDTTFNQTCPDGVQFGHCRPNNLNPGNNPGVGQYNRSVSETVDGWVYGGGVEAAISSNWSLRAEYLRYDFGSQSYALGESDSGQALGSKTLEHDVDVVRVGVNYKFGGREEMMPLK
jgi:outer membrane immunogenic protein